MGPQRPKLLGLVCWVLIIGGFVGLVLALKESGGEDFAKSMRIYPYPLWLAITLLFAPRALMVVSGILMYERQGWARYFYIITMPVFFLQEYLGLGKATAATTAAEAQKLLLHKALFGGEVLLFLVSIPLLFLYRTRRYYRPPMYVDE